MRMSVRRLTLLVAICLAPGCSSSTSPTPTPPADASPDASPADAAPTSSPPTVTILSPATLQALPAGQAIDVRFTVSGVDATGATPVAFQLADGTTKTPGSGKVVAFIDSSSAVAEIHAVPTDANPFKVPGEAMGDPATLVQPGSHRVILRLYYNDGTAVSPQRDGEVTIQVQ